MNPITTVSDFTLTVNHLNQRMVKIEKEIKDLHNFKLALLYLHQQKQVDLSITNLELEYATLLSILKYMVNLKGESL